jgi:hypothetical protein
VAQGRAAGSPGASPERGKGVGVLPLDRAELGIERAELVAARYAHGYAEAVRQIEHE